ncbi:hypothetical protein HID58_032043 [Brassica napus]|uniref:Uncharacterized protein n=7 Tax=Brassica TaxID=3705 RepID=A0ABQ8BW48_BRANA|nr:hypothetical protein HID58_032043 [Brassica napus]
MKGKGGNINFKMSVSRLFFGVLTILAVVSSILLSMAHAQSAAPAPAPTSDGTTIDQGIAYLLMLVALVLTYLIH